MAGFDFSFLSNALDDTKGSGISFESQAKKWETEDQAKEIVDAIDGCKSLQFLNLEGNTLGVDAARAIGKALEKHPEFKRALFKDLFTGRLKTEIPQALQLMGKGMITAGANLTVFDCSDNALGPNGMVGLVELFKSPSCYSLQELKLNNCGLGIGGGEMLAKALTDCHAASVQAGTPLRLKVFIAGRNRLENAGAKALAGFFEKVGSLEHVAMPQNGIYHPGITALSEGFKCNSNMKILNLNDNTIGPIGAESIADALYSMQNLEEINFGDCLLKTRGAVILAEALQDGHLALETLILESNEIGPNGGCAIASAMANKDLLKKLVLNINQFGEEGRESIREILEDHQRGRVLDELDEDDSDGEDEDDDEVGDGEDDDDEDEDDDDDDETCEVVDDEYDEDTEDNQSGYSIGQHNVSLDITAPTSESFANNLEQSNTIESFLLTPHPTVAQFNALAETNKLEAIRSYLSSLSQEDYLVFLVYAILKLSDISSKSADILHVATELYKDCYEHAEKTNQLLRVNHFFLTQLGLLKAEDKTFTSIYNFANCRSVLQNAIKSKVFSDNIQSMFSLFLASQ